ncbi:phage replication protein O [Geosporobacter subterraneus DSM 17957]|uniref:Phage replication protein O n=1 Tax=Geosporobacter subterraneus DSM 17957 TaxID=1121919 RepID=A0A1M6DSB7_9FIRM|nr:replication protein [Geosporobacter subterraneus]SHI76073.1 phage replication protein O [Geosporobacter subterraneus DSM 17957]
MASPQKENGYTAIANELLEQIYQANFNATQLKIILFIMRYTYGFNRKQHEISIGFIVKGTSISKRYVSSELNKLVEKKVVVVVQEHTDTQSRVLKINKNYDEWDIGTKLQQVKNCSTDEEKQGTTDEELFTTTGEELFYQESKNKTNIKESTITTKEIDVKVYEENGLDLIERFYMEKVLGSSNIGTKDMQLILEAYQTYPADFIVKCMGQACNRYREKNGEMNIKSFKYFESVFKDEWTKLKIREQAESVVPEEPVIDFSKRNVQKQQKQISGKPNRFHNFEQRTAKYSKEELEKMVKEKG